MDTTTNTTRFTENVIQELSELNPLNPIQIKFWTVILLRTRVTVVKVMCEHLFQREYIRHIQSHGHWWCYIRGFWALTLLWPWYWEWPWPSSVYQHDTLTWSTLINQKLTLEIKWKNSILFLSVNHDTATSFLLTQNNHLINKMIESAGLLSMSDEI